MQKASLSLPKGGKSAGGTYDELEFEQVPQGEVWCVQSGSIINRTTAYTKLQIFLRTGTIDEELEEEPSPAAAELYWLDKEYYLRAGQKIVARLTGCTSGDILYGWLRGYRAEA